MAFIQTIPEAEATGKVREMYERNLKKRGYVPNYTKLLSLRPEVMETWSNLQAAIRSNMPLRQWELVTITVAASLHCTY
jgi:hypothetical protein